MNELEMTIAPEMLEKTKEIIKKVTSADKEEKQYFKLDYLPDGFLKDYCLFAEPLTEAPIQYHIATALSLVATAIGRNILLEEGATTYYPNLYILIIGESGSTRKSTATGLIKQFLNKIDRTLLLGTSFSKEAFLEAFKSNYCHLILYDELRALLDNVEKSYGIGLMTDFTTLWACPPFHRFEFKNTEEADREIEKPTLNILACSTPDWMLKERDIGGGFLGRFLPIYSEKPTKRLAIRPKMDKIEFNRLLNELQRLRQIKGEYTWTPEAQETFEGLYNEIMDGISKEEDKAKLAPYWSRIDTHIRKLAMIFDLCSNQPTFTITKDNLMRAYGILDLITESYRQMLGTISFSFTDKKEKQLLKMIEEAGQTGLEHSKALRNLHIDAKLMQGLVYTLQDKKLLVRAKRGKGRDEEIKYFSNQFASYCELMDYTCEPITPKFA